MNIDLNKLLNVYRVKMPEKISMIQISFKNITFKIYLQ